MNLPSISLKKTGNLPIRMDEGKMSNRFISKAIILSFAALFAVTACSGEKARQKTEITDPAALRGGETRNTLSPTLFTGPEARAYQIAKEIPEVLDSLYCYCDCEKHFGHKSLLTCYVDEHAKHCDICMDEAFMAYELHKQGMDVIAIRKAVDQKFSNLRH